MMIENIQRSLDLLPQEIIEEILSTLDVKSLLRFRCVSKSYRSLIDSKPFIKTHLQKSTKNTTLAHHRVVILTFQFQQPEEEVCGCSLLSFIDSSDNSDYKPPELNFPTNIYSSVSLVGCCNGLVCILLDIVKNSAQFILWNPSTRIFKKLPDFDKKNKSGSSKFQYFGFGWDESSDDYKVIAIVGDENQSMCLYSLKADSWKQIDAYCHLQRRSVSQTGMLVSGKLHWDHDDITKSCPHQWEIIAFDLKAEVFEIVEQPCYSEGSITCHCLGTLGECLAVLCFYENGDEQIWALKEYGVKESWEKVMVINDNDGLSFWTSSSVAAFCHGEKGEILLMNLENEMKYLAFDLKNKCIHGTDGLGESNIYVESLVSPLE